MKKLYILSITFLMFFFSTNAQYLTSIGTVIDKENSSTKTITNLFTEIAMLEVEYFDNDRVFTNENITSYILGLSSSLELNKTFNLTGSLGFAEGFSYSFATSNLALKLSENFHMFYGIGGYYISDERWAPNGLDGNEPSRYDFGMNMGLQLYLSKHLGLIMRYNILEEKEEVRDDYKSMSINGLSFGLIIK